MAITPKDIRDLPLRDIDPTAVDEHVLAEDASGADVRACPYVRVKMAASTISLIC